MTADGYVVAWVAYLVGAFLLYAAGWWMTKRWPAWLSYPLRAVVLVVLVLPWAVKGNDGEKGPAWVVAAFDSFVLPNGDPLRAGAPLIVVAALAFIVSVLLCAVHYLRK